MTAPFTVSLTVSFTRTFRKLSEKHPGLDEHLAQVITTLETDPYNRTRKHPIKKLVNMPDGEQYRIRIRRFRFLYDISDQHVYLTACSLRREDTYR